MFGVLGHGLRAGGGLGAAGGGAVVLGVGAGLALPAGFSVLGASAGTTSDPGSASVGSVTNMGAVGRGLGFGGVASVEGPDDPLLVAVASEPPAFLAVAPASLLAGGLAFGGAA